LGTEAGGGREKGRFFETRRNNGGGTCREKRNRRRDNVRKGEVEREEEGKRMAGKGTIDKRGDEERYDRNEQLEREE
jgi:hypothetical protein